MANWTAALLTMTPPRLGSSAVVTSTFAAHSLRSKSPGVDIDWPGQAGLAHPSIFSPIAGKITAAGEDSWNTVNIIDKDGNKHGFLHMYKVSVHVGQEISAGEQIGYLGGTGPAKGGKSPTAYRDHLHYQLTLKGSTSRADPIAWWNANQSQGDVQKNFGSEPVSEEIIDTQGNVDPPGGVAPPPAALQKVMPVQAEEASMSSADKALWTNRVPEHEPWPRTLKAQPQKDSNATQAWSDNKGMAYQDADETARQDLNRHHINEFPDESAWVGRVEGDVFNERNPLWRR